MNRLNRIALRPLTAWLAPLLGEPPLRPRWRPVRPGSRLLSFDWKRNCIISSGIALTALGLAIIVGALAAMYAERGGPIEALVAVAASSQTLASSAFSETAQARANREAPVPQFAASGASPPFLPAPAPLQVEAPPRPRPNAAALLAAETLFTPKGRIANVNITFYDCAGQGFCGAMANGRKVYEGAAACSYNLPIGTRFIIVGDPTGRIYSCEDRGLLASTWVDVFFYDPSDGYRWQAQVGRRGVIELVDLPGR